MNSIFKDVGVTAADWTGKEHVFRDLSKTSWFIDNTRFGKTNARESLASFRKAYVQKVTAEAIKFDQWDEKFLNGIVHPKSDEQQSMMAAFERIYDDVAIDMLGADSLGGVDPYITAQAFPASQIVPVNYVKPGTALGSNTGMTIWKLVKAKLMFEKLEVDPTKERVMLIMSPDEEASLLLQAESAPNDFWAKMVGEWYTQRAAGNKTAKLLGMFEVRISNRLKTISSGTIRVCYAVCSSAFVKAPVEVRVRMDVLPHDKHCLQLAGYAVLGMARRYDEKVIQIPCLIPTA